MSIITNTMIDNILNKSKLSRTDLSTIYKKIKELKLQISWLDLFRKSSREASLSTLQQAIKPKPKKTNQLKELLKTIKNTKPESNEYYVLTAKFTDGSKTHSTITPQSKFKIMYDIENITNDKIVLDGNAFSDATSVLLKGKTIKSFSLEKKEEFEKKSKITIR